MSRLKCSLCASACARVFLRRPVRDDMQTHNNIAVSSSLAFGQPPRQLPQSICLSQFHLFLDSGAATPFGATTLFTVASLPCQAVSLRKEKKPPIQMIKEDQSCSLKG